MFFQESCAKVFTSHYSFYHQSIPRQFAQNRIKPNFISKDISINIVLNYFRQRPPIARDNRFAVFHRFDGDEAEGFPAAGHDDGVAGGVVAREFFVWYPAEEGDAVGVFLFDFYAAADNVVADDGEVEVVALAGVECLQEDIEAFWGIKSADEQEVDFPQG